MFDYTLIEEKYLNLPTDLYLTCKAKLSDQ